MEDKNDMRAYVKPELFYENFELAQNIATCGWDVKTSGSAATCGAIGDEEYGFLPVEIFNDSQICDYTDIENYCYEPSSSGAGLFNS